MCSNFDENFHQNSDFYPNIIKEEPIEPDNIFYKIIPDNYYFKEIETNKVDTNTSIYLNNAKNKTLELFKINYTQENDNDITKNKTIKEIRNLSKNEKLFRRREKNRISANRSAYKKRDYVKQLEEIVVKLENENNYLKQQII